MTVLEFSRTVLIFFFLNIWILLICDLQKPVGSVGSEDSPVAPPNAGSAIPPDNYDVEAEAAVNLPGVDWFPKGKPWPELAKSPVSHEKFVICFRLGFILLPPYPFM